MTCSYCGTRNADGEHRCRRCGRRPDDTLTGEFGLVRTEGALAAKPDAEAAARTTEAATRPAPQLVAQAAAAASDDRKAPLPLSRAVQSSLFHQKSGLKVVPIAEYAPAPPRVARPKAPAKPGQRRARPVCDEQAQLPFLPPQTAKPRSPGTVDSVIYCEAPVATALHRLVAAALDWSMVLIGYGLLLVVFRALGGDFILNKTNGMVFGGMLLVTGFAYGAVWAVAGVETAGMHWMRLRLTTFDGFPPEPRQRALRFLGSCLSACTVLGMLWSLADEESLTWQDHISRTFPTPILVDEQVFRRA